MIYVFALLTGLIGAVAGFFAGLALGSALAPIFGISSFEGGAGYFAVAIGLLVGLIGLVMGIALALRYKGGQRGFAAIAGRSVIVLGGLAALVFIGIQIRLATLENFPGGQNPQLDFEIRLPAGAAEPQRKQIDIEMQAGSQRSGGLLNDDWLWREDERYVLSGIVRLYTRTSSRILVVSRSDQPKLLFSIGLAATPKVSEQFGNWQRVNFVDDGKPDSQPRKPSNAENYEIRVRVPDWK